LLGVCQDPMFEEASVDLAVGDTLILYTDGVIEQRDSSPTFSERHLGMLVRNRRNVVDAEATAQLIEDTVHLVAPERVRDDVAILVAWGVAVSRPPPFGALLCRGPSNWSRCRSSAMSPPRGRFGPVAQISCRLPSS